MKNLEKRLSYLTGNAIRDYRMVEDGDRIMVCLSGGKDSYTLLEILLLLQQRAPVRFELIAVEMGITKIALGHHRDDILATLFLNMFYGSKLATMPPKLRSNDGRHVVIRPLAYVTEKYCARYAELREFPAAR